MPQNTITRLKIFEFFSLGFPGGSAGKEFACNAGNLGWEESLEKGKVTHSSILAWRIPWTVQSMGSQSQTQLGELHLKESQCVTPLYCTLLFSHMAHLQFLGIGS